jgi:hypothetical protein
MIPVPMTTLGRALAIAASLAIGACSAGAGPIQSSPTPSPRAISASTPLGSPSNAATSLETTTPTVAADSPLASASPAPTPKATAATVPAKPTGVTFTTDSVEVPGPTGASGVTYTVTHRVRWTTPRTEGVEIRVYGVTDCLSEPSNPAPGTSGPCLVEHTTLPPSVTVLAARAPAAAGEISWIAPRSYTCAGPPVGPDGRDYQATVVAAYTAAGHSIFAIADPGGWWRAGPDEVVC